MPLVRRERSWTHVKFAARYFIKLMRAVGFHLLVPHLSPWMWIRKFQHFGNIPRYYYWLATHKIT
jgi:hypothetical protein